MTTKKMLPCSLYDIQGLQSWLDEMALQGLFFQGFTKRNDTVEFQTGAPRPVRYRVDPVRKKEDDQREEPYAQMGWTFVDAMPRLYYVFSCDDPDAPELHSDPETLAYALRYSIQKQIRYHSVWILAVTLLLTALLFFLRRQLWEDLLLVEDLRSLVLLGFQLLVFLFNVILPFLHIRQLVKARRSLEQGLPPKAGRRWHRERNLTIYFCVVAPLFVLFIFSFPSDRPERQSLDRGEPSHLWPTLGQLEAAGPQPLEEEPQVEGHLRSNCSWAVPIQERVSLDWRVRTFDPDTGETTALDRPYDLRLKIWYDRACSLWMAGQVYQIRRDQKATELEDALSYSYGYRITDLQPFQQVDRPGLDRLETARFRRSGQDVWAFALLRGDEVLVVEHTGSAPLEAGLELFLDTLDQTD